MVRVCFVCLGNICRSPTAEGIMRKRVREVGLETEIGVESAGTADYHVGEPPDRRTMATARLHGVDLESLARQFEAADFERFDYVLAMDESNAARLRSMARNDAERDKVQRLLEYAGDLDSQDVPDPYYGGSSGFQKVFDLCDAACRGLLAHIRKEHAL